jgi:Flp pilus assembly protein TadG
MTGRFSKLVRDRTGAALVEFAIVAPVLALVMVGAFDVGHTLYVRAVVQGALQKAARDSGLESGLTTNAALDAKVASQIKAVTGNSATVTFGRRFYRTFSAAAAARAEPFTDTNGNSECDAGEPFEDQNHNNVRDADGADEGQGGAKDSVLYTVTVSFPRMFPLNEFMALSDTTTVKGSMILANQPYGDQGSYAAPAVRHCA